MQKEIHEVVRSELEYAYNKCINGDLTPAVFGILKKTPDLQGLCNALGIVTKRRVSNPTNNTSMFDQLIKAGIKLE